jgi:hypothetical protein
MPRDLTDLMESATSFAPPEPHDADAITRLAVQRQRRRTTSLVGGVALAVVVAGAAGYGAAHGHESTPEPLGPYRYGQHPTLADAVTSAHAPWFRTFDYGVPSVLPGAHDRGPVAEYLDVDAQGRLAAMQAHWSADGQELSATYQVVDGPGGHVHQVPEPSTGLPRGAVPPVSFTSDGRLLWGVSDGNGSAIFAAVTDRDGQDPVAMGRTMAGVPGKTGPLPHSKVDVWFDGGRVWFSALTKDDFPGHNEWISLFSFDPAHPSVLRAEKPQNVSTIDVAGGEAVWLDGSTVRAEDLATGDVRVVGVPIDAGCHAPAVSEFSGGLVTGYLTTDGDLLSLLEECQNSWHVVVTDFAGRVVADVDSGPGKWVFRPTLTGDILGLGGGGFRKGTGPSYSYALDLRTGRFVRIGRPQRIGLPANIAASGRYVLWYDRAGGHVGELTE